MCVNYVLLIKWTELLQSGEWDTRPRDACPAGKEFRFRSGVACNQLAPWPPGLLRLAVWLAICDISLNTSRPESFSPPSLLASRAAAGSSRGAKKGLMRKWEGWAPWGAALLDPDSCLGMMQSWTCLRCCFILSGRENSFWHTGHGNTFLLAPSWYRKACRWKLYLFLKLLTIWTFSHWMHR